LYRDRIELISIARGGEVLDRTTILLPVEQASIHKDASPVTLR